MRYSARTDTGQVREHNEDTFACAPERGLFIIADGMGGHARGEMASRLASDRALEAVTARYDPALPGVEWDFPGILSSAINDAHAQVVAENRGLFGHDAMGTTLIAVIATADTLHYAHAGDSRLYVVPASGGIAQVTRDQTVAQQKIDQGEETPNTVRFYGHLLSSYIGTDKRFTPVIDRRTIDRGDIFILCTDGLTDMVPDEEIGEIATANAGEVDAIADTLIARANDNGGRDNITVIVLDPSG